MRINLGTVNKVEAKYLRTILKTFKKIRSKTNKGENFEVIFRSRTYGNINNLHDRTQRISNAEKVAVYLAVKPKRENIEWIQTANFPLENYDEARECMREESNRGRVCKWIKMPNQYRVRIYRRLES